MSAPEHVTATCDALRTAGWLDAADAAAVTGRTIGELGRLWDAGHIQVLAFSWHDDGMQRARHMVRTAEVQAAPRMPALRVVTPGGAA